MHARSAAYDRVVEQLTPVLHDMSGKLVAIDGRDGSGKTTLGRFLAWHFDITLIETDPFLGEGMTYRTDVIDLIIAHRLARPRPVIIEGIMLLRLLSSLGRSADFLIHVTNTEFQGSSTLADELLRYEQQFNPRQRADLILELSLVA